MKKFVLGLAAVAALGITTALAVTPPPPPPPAPDFSAAVACTPLTSSQSAQPGDAQSCRVRIRNNSDSPITGIMYERPTPNTLTGRVPLKASYGLNCGLNGCDPFTLAPGASVIIWEYSTFNATQDGRGRTVVTATGTLDGDTVTASGIEQNTLP